MRVSLLGFGAVGEVTAYDLERSSEVASFQILDSMDSEKMQKSSFSSFKKAEYKEVDASDITSLTQAITGSDVIINTLPFKLNFNVMQAALNTKIPYVDLGGLYHVTKEQVKWDEKFKDAGVLGIIGVGGAPGITNVFAKYGAEQLDTIDFIHFYDGGIEEHTPEDVILRWGYSIDTILDEVESPAIVWKEGDYLELPTYKDGLEKYVFPEPIGTLRTDWCLHSELGTIPESFKEKGLKEVFYKINFSNLPEEEGKKFKFLTDLGFSSIKPLNVRGQEIVPRDVLKELLKKLPPIEEEGGAYESVCCVTKGKKNGSDLVYELQALAYTTSGSPLTGWPSSIVAELIYKGAIKGVGIFAPEKIIPCDLFFQGLKKRGIKVFINTRKIL